MSGAVVVDLYLTIIGGEGLVSKDANGLSDPYTKVEIRDSEGNSLYKRDTKVIRKTLNPTWNERSVFNKVPTSGVIHLEVWDWDRIGGHDYMGETSVKIKELQKVQAQQKEISFPLVSSKPKENVSGNIKIKAVLVDASGKGGVMSIHSSSLTISEDDLLVNSNVPNAMGMNMLHRAAYIGDVKLLKGFAEKPEALKEKALMHDHWNALQYAAFGGQVEAVKFLLPLCGKLKYEGLSPLHLAVAGKNVDTIKALLSAFPVSKAEGPFKETPLHIACRGGASADVVSALLSDGKVDGNAKNAMGKSPLYYALKRCDEAVISLLVPLCEWDDSCDSVLPTLSAQMKAHVAAVRKQKKK